MDRTMHNDDEESALLILNKETTFDVPNTSVKSSRKFLIATIAIALLLAISILFKPQTFNYAGRGSTGLQEVGRLDNGAPSIIIAKPLPQGLPEGFQLFEGSVPIPVQNIPVAGTSAALPVITHDIEISEKKNTISILDKNYNDVKVAKLKSSASGNLVLCTATVELKKEAYVAPQGCAMISDIDITYTSGKNPANLLIVCAPQNIGTFPLDSETLESFGMIKDNKSLISYVTPGSDASVAVYTGENFDGNTYVINNNIEPIKDIAPENNFNSWKVISNDNVKSLIFHSTADVSPKSCKEVKKLVGYKELKQ